MPEPVAHRGSDTPQQVSRAVERLKAYHAMGRASLTEYPERVAHGHSNELLRKARVFATRYTEADLERLIDLCRSHSTALGRSFVDRLATIPDKRQRKAMETQAVRERWSRIMLDRQIRRRYGRRWRQGRAPHRPVDVDDALSELIRLTLKLVRWSDMMQAERSSGGISLDKLPTAVRRQAEQALPAVRRLQDLAEEALERRRQTK